MVVVVVKFGCQAILFIAFIYQVVNSLNKLQHGELGTSIAEESVVSHPLPTFTVCRTPNARTRKLRGINETSMEKAYQEIDEKSLPVINAVILGIHNSSDNLTSNEHLIADSRTRLQRTYLVLNGELFPCDVVTIHTNVSSSVTTRVSFIPSTSNWTTLIQFDGADQFVAPGNEVLGGMMTVASNLLADTTTVISLKEKVISSISRPNHICDERGRAKMFQCTQEYLMAKMPCHLPWLSVNKVSPKRPCNQTQDWISFKVLWEDLYLDVTYDKFTRITGCVPNCRYRKYSTKINSLNIPHPFDPLPFKQSHTLNIQMRQSMITVQSEKYFYDSSSFIADVGGFLGLLLGLSVMDIVDIVINVVRKAIRVPCKSDPFP